MEHSYLKGISSLRNLLFLFLLISEVVFAASFSDSVLIGGSGPANSKAQLEVQSTSNGVLLPRMTTTQQNAISTPPEGLLLYDNVLHQLSNYNGSAWVAVGGTPTAATTTTLGAVKAFTPVANQFLTGITSGTGVPTAAQPAFTNISGTASTAQLPIVPTSKGGLGADESAATGVVSISAGTVSVGTCSIANGCTGQTTALASFDALSPLTTAGDTLSFGSGHNVRIGTGPGDAGKAWISGAGSVPNSWSVLGVAGGGTGVATLTSHGVLLGAGTSAVAATAAGSSGQVLRSGGASADPAYSTATFPNTATTGDVLVATGTNTWGNLAASTSGYVLTAQGAGVAPIYAPATSGAAAYNYTAQTTTYSAAVNDYILMSGASFTVTLPTAVGKAGQSIFAKHNGTSLTQVYTFNTTSSQTMNGPNGAIASGSYALYTKGETVGFMSDGANWQVFLHFTATDTVDAGVMTITATTTNPTKSNSPTADKIKWYRNGRYAYLNYSFVASTAVGAAAGTGDYKFALPSNMTADTTGVVLYTTVVGNGAAYHVSNIIGTGDVGFVTASTPVTLSLFDSTTFRAFAQVSVVNGALGSAANGNLTGSTITYNFKIQVPIAGWQP